MSNSDRYVPENAALREYALAWLRRLNAGEATASDIAELEKWRSTSPAHAREFTEAVLLWDVLAEAAKEAASQAVKKTEASYSNRDGTLAFPAGNRRLARRTFLAGGAALAASVAGGALVVRPPFDLWPSLSEITADYRTRPGERRRIEVAAHVSVEMNTRTSIDLQSDAQVTLLAGEVAVAKQGDPVRELVVLAGNGRAAAMAASFNMRKDGDVVTVTCTNGEVEVRCGEAVAAVRGGQQVAYDNLTLSEVTTIDPEVVTAWQRGLLIFRRRPLSQVIDEVNRYRSGRIILRNAELGQRQVVGNFRLDRIDDVIDFISKAMNLPIRSLPGGMVLVG